MTEIKKVVLLGADGTVGPFVLEALLSHNFHVTVLKRAESKSSDKYPEGVKIAKVSDEFKVNDLVEVLRGQDALVVTIKAAQVDIQKRLADASIKAGVKRLIPADFGSCDSSTDWSQRLVPLYQKKTELRDYLTKMAENHAQFTWTGIVPGHFIDWQDDFLHFWPDKKRATILDDGETRHSISTLARVGEATARVLQNLSETANKTLYVQSFCITQNQLLKAFEEVTGSSWEVKKVKSADLERDEKAKADGGDTHAIEELVWMLGTLDANWETRDGFAMEMLGLEDEDLHAVVKRLAQK